MEEIFMKSLKCVLILGISEILFGWFNYGKVGTEKSNELVGGYVNFKIDAMIHDARLQKGLTQEELAKKNWNHKIIYFKN
ncbi:MAG TPA: hypothetical protein VFS71_09850 [Flavobacterium sp.]|nr:hypothetical protein [Flavobacterium sp.]